MSSSALPSVWRCIEPACISTRPEEDTSFQVGNWMETTDRVVLPRQYPPHCAEGLLGFVVAATRGSKNAHAASTVHYIRPGMFIMESQLGLCLYMVCSKVKPTLYVASRPCRAVQAEVKSSSCVRRQSDSTAPCSLHPEMGLWASEGITRYNITWHDITWHNVTIYSKEVLQNRQHQHEHQRYRYIYTKKECAHLVRGAIFFSHST